MENTTNKTNFKNLKSDFFLFDSILCDDTNDPNINFYNDKLQEINSATTSSKKSVPQRQAPRNRFRNDKLQEIDSATTSIIH